MTPPNIYLFKFKNRNIRKSCEICSKLLKKHQNDVNKVILVFLCFYCWFRTYFTPLFSVFIVETETVNVRWGRRSGDFIANFEHISHLFLLFLLFTLNNLR